MANTSSDPSPGTEYFHDEPYDSGFVVLSDVHKLHYRQFGKKSGKTALFLHGGPGGCCTARSTIFFNPLTYRTITFDQRGAGLSTPPASLHENTTHHLIADIEALRTHLAIEKWHLVFGGSWGSTLALAYAQAHPSAVGSLILRGVFLLRRAELEWTYGNSPGAGLRNVFPEYHAKYIDFLPEEKRANPMRAYYDMLISDDPEVSMPAARAWSGYELAVSGLLVNEASFARLHEDPAWALAHSRIEAHYFVHGGWLEEGQLLKKENVDRIRHIPATIVQGRYDMVCPAKSAWDLHQVWPEAKFVCVPDAGHSAEELGTKKKLIELCDQYAKL